MGSLRRFLEPRAPADGVKTGSSPLRRLRRGLGDDRVRDRLGDELLLAVVELRVLFVAVQADQRVCQLVHARRGAGVVARQVRADADRPLRGLVEAVEAGRRFLDASQRARTRMWLRSPRRTQYSSASQARKPATRVASGFRSAICSWLRSGLYPYFWLDPL